MQIILKVGDQCLTLRSGRMFAPETIMDIVVLKGPRYPSNSYTIDKDAEICVYFVPDDRLDLGDLAAAKEEPLG